MFRAFKRVFIWLGLMAEQATETDAINQAVVERGIRDSKVKADKAHYAEELATMESDINENKAQLDSLEQLYKQNTEIIAQSLREIQKFQREFESVKAKVAIGRSLEGLAGMMKSSITELQGMVGGELGQSMQQLRQSAASGEGQMRATLDLAKEMGSGIARQQEMRKARGAMLFQEYKKKMGMVQSEAAAPQTGAGISTGAGGQPANTGNNPFPNRPLNPDVAPGGRVQNYPGGVVVRTLPDGTTIVTQPNGRRMVTRPNGTTQVFGPGGAPIRRPLRRRAP